MKDLMNYLTAAYQLTVSESEAEEMLAWIIKNGIYELPANESKTQIEKYVNTQFKGRFKVLSEHNVDYMKTIFLTIKNQAQKAINNQNRAQPLPQSNINRAKK